jgi:hypothetical protein
MGLDVLAQQHHIRADASSRQPGQVSLTTKQAAINVNYINLCDMFIFAPFFCNLSVKTALPFLRSAVVAMILIKLNFVVI